MSARLSHNSTDELKHESTPFEMAPNERRLGDWKARSPHVDNGTCVSEDYSDRGALDKRHMFKLTGFGDRQVGLFTGPQTRELKIDPSQDRSIIRRSSVGSAKDPNIHYNDGSRYAHELTAVRQQPHLRVRKQGWVIRKVGGCLRTFENDAHSTRTRTTRQGIHIA